MFLGSYATNIQGTVMLLRNHMKQMQYTKVVVDDLWLWFVLLKHLAKLQKSGKGEEFQRKYWVASIITRRQSFSCTFMLIITLDATNVYVDHNRPLPLILLKSIQRCQFGWCFWNINKSKNLIDAFTRRAQNEIVKLDMVINCKLHYHI